MIRVLFVCLGNICRSPMAQAVFDHKARAAGISDYVQSDSAGTGDYHAGSPAHPGTQRMLTEKGVTDPQHAARQITPSDLNTFDYVLTMDGENLTNVQRLGSGRAIIKPLMEFAPQMGVDEVPDPYYTGGFEGVYQLIEAACDGLIAEIQERLQMDEELPGAETRL